MWKGGLRLLRLWLDIARTKYVGFCRDLFWHARGSMTMESISYVEITDWKAINYYYWVLIAFRAGHTLLDIAIDLCGYSSYGGMRCDQLNKFCSTNQGRRVLILLLTLFTCSGLLIIFMGFWVGCVDLSLRSMGTYQRHRHDLEHVNLWFSYR